MEVFLIRLLQFMLSISLLVLLHEGGHMFFSKLFGVRVEKFYLFFDPWFHLFEWKPKHSETTFGIGWLPLGGYCKISGMIDESFDTDQMKKPAQPWEFRSKPAWQRLLIMVGGVLVNFLLALFIYSMVLFHWGDEYVSLKDYTYGMKFNQEAKALGFHDHDILLGTDLGSFKGNVGDVYRDLSRARRCDVLRQGKRVSIALPGNLNMLEMAQSAPRFVMPFMPLQIDSVVKGSPAEKIGLQPGDRVVAVNGKPVDSYNAFTDEVGRLHDLMTGAKTHRDSLAVRKVSLVLERKGAAAPDTVGVVLSADLTLGFYNHSVLDDYKTTHVSYGFLESFPAGVKYGWNVLAGYVSDFRYVFSFEGAKNLGGFGSIGSLFPPTWDWHAFWMMTAFLSIILAFMNILPIPALDGGHVLFLLYEMITRRKPSEKFMIIAEYVGIAILLLLMVVANLNDVLRWLGLM